MTTEWRAPPPVTHWADRLEPLKEHPERWAMVKTCPTRATAYSTVWKLRHRARFKVPDGEWEFRAGGCEVFARYMGEE